MKRMFTVVILVPLLFMQPATSGASVTGPFSLEKDRTLIDQSGRKIELGRPFSRIISLYGAHTENLFHLGLGPEIVGVTKLDQSQKKASGIAIFSYHDDPEKYLAAKPDLVLIRPMIDRGYAKLMRRLEHSGITVVSIQPRNVKELYQYWVILGALTGTDLEAIKMLKRFQQAVKEYRVLAGSIKNRKRVYFEAMHKNMKTFSSGSMADFVLKAAGGINIADDGIPSRGTNIAIYGKEKIMSRANEIDVFLAQTGAMNRPSIEIIRNEPGFSAIKAIKNHEIYIIDEQIVSRPTMRLLQGIHQIGSILYPDQYAEERDEILRKAVRPWIR